MKPLPRLLARLHGVGGKRADQLAAAIGAQPEDYKMALARAVVDHGAPIPCPTCGDDGGPDECDRCQDPHVDRTRILVVKSTRDRQAVEATGCWSGAYHVLRGVLDQAHGVGADQLKVRALFERLRSTEVVEVVFGLGGSPRAEETAQRLAALILPSGISCWALGVGVAPGTELEYVDAETLTTAIQRRRSVT